MRNDSFDDSGDLPSLTAEPREPRKALIAGQAATAQRNREPGTAAPARRASSHGVLWTLLVAALVALFGLAWWSHQQLGLMAQQLVATQESFARISEEAAGRIQDITGKVVATESTVATGTEALKLELQALSRQLRNQAAQQAKRIDGLDGQLKAQAIVADKFDERLKALGVELGTLKGLLPGEVKRLETQLAAQAADQSQFSTQIKSLGADVQALKKQNAAQAIKRLEQELASLRNRVDAQTSPTGGSTAEYDTFRAQVTRNINALQSQMQSLKQQLDAR